MPRWSGAAGTSRLAPASGIEDFGASHVVLEPGAWSSQRHWHEGEDELVVMLSGEAVLVDDHGETPLRAGDIAVFPKNDGNGHVLQNRSDAPCAFVAIGRPAVTDCPLSRYRHAPLGGSRGAAQEGRERVLKRSAHFIAGCVSHCAIVHSSSSAAFIQPCSHSCSISACM